MIHDLDRLQALARGDDPDAAFALALAASRQQQRLPLLFAGRRLATLADAAAGAGQETQPQRLLYDWLTLISDEDRRCLTIHAVFDSPTISDPQRFTLNEPCPIATDVFLEQRLLRRDEVWLSPHDYPERGDRSCEDVPDALCVMWTELASGSLQALLRDPRHNGSLLRSIVCRTLHQRHIFVAARPDVIATRSGGVEWTVSGGVAPDEHFGFKQSWILRTCLMLLCAEPTLIDATLGQRLMALLNVNDDAYRACRRARRERTQSVVVDVLMPALDRLPDDVAKALMRFGHGDDYRTVIETLVDHFALQGRARADSAATLERLVRTSRGTTLRLLLDVLARRFEELSPSLQHGVLDRSRVVGPRDSLLRVILNHLNIMRPETAHVARALIARELEAFDQGRPSHIFCQALSDHLVERVPTQRVNPFVSSRVPSIMEQLALHPEPDIRMLAARLWVGRTGNPFPDLDHVYRRPLADDHPVVRAAMGS